MARPSIIFILSTTLLRLLFPIIDANVIIVIITASEYGRDVRRLATMAIVFLSISFLPVFCLWALFWLVVFFSCFCGFLFYFPWDTPFFFFFLRAHGRKSDDGLGGRRSCNFMVFWAFWVGGCRGCCWYCRWLYCWWRGGGGRGRGMIAIDLFTSLSLSLSLPLS